MFGPIVDTYAQREITGCAQLGCLRGPAIFVANHCSHVDTPLLLRSLPAGLRRRTAVVAAADYFYTRRLLANAVSLAFCTIPLERRGGGVASDATAHIEQLIDNRWSLVVFAEGTRSRNGNTGRLLPGAAVLAAEHRLPIVPIHISGTHQVMAPGRRWMVRAAGVGAWPRHRLRVSFGAPIHVGPRDDRFEVMELVRLFMAGCGASTTPDPKLTARRAAAAAKAIEATGAAASQRV